MSTRTPRRIRSIFQFVGCLGAAGLFVTAAIPFITSPSYVQMEGHTEGLARMNACATFQRNWFPDGLLLAAVAFIAWGLFLLLGTARK